MAGFYAYSDANGANGHKKDEILIILCEHRTHITPQTPNLGTRIKRSLKYR